MSATAAGYGSPVITGSGDTRTFTFTASAQIAGNGSKSFEPVVTRGQNSNLTLDGDDITNSNSFTITAYPTAGAGGSGVSGKVLIALS